MDKSAVVISLTKRVEETSLDSIINNAQILRQHYLSYIEVDGVDYFEYLEKALKDSFSNDEIVEYFVKVAKKGIETNEFQIKKATTVKYLYEYVFGAVSWRCEKEDTSKQFVIDRMKEAVTLVDKFVREIKVAKRDVDSKDIKAVMNSFQEDELEEYITNIIRNDLNLSRNKISLRLLLEYIFHIDKPNAPTYDYFLKVIKDNGWLRVMNKVIEAEAPNNNQALIDSNISEMKLTSDRWTLYYINGISLYRQILDFSEIKSEGLKKEIKMFIKAKYTPDKVYFVYKRYSNAKRILNLLYDEFEIEHFSEIENIHAVFALNYMKNVGGFAPSSIKATKASITDMIDYYINLKEYPFKPIENAFKNIGLKGTDRVVDTTEYIPDEVMSQIDAHINELSERFQLMYEVFSCTGARAKEVIRLEANKSYYIKGNEDYCELKYNPHKVKNTRKRKGLPEYHTVFIPKNLHERLEAFADTTLSLRAETNSEFLFIDKSKRGTALTTPGSFCRVINNLIKKHDIRDIEGNLWNFTSKQMRKTLAVQLISNNATRQEVATQFGHNCIDTTEKFYLEVKLKDIAEMNHVFFNKKFRLNMNDKDLELYTEEERRQLYVDFCLNNREVEYGYCTKHLSEGSCGTRNGRSNCATCNKLCTGKKFLDKWLSLKDSQQKIVDELLETYKQYNIEDYEDFVEYKREVHLLESYKVVVESIEKG